MEETMNWNFELVTIIERKLKKNINMEVYGLLTLESYIQNMN